MIAKNTTSSSWDEGQNLLRYGTKLDLPDTTPESCFVAIDGALLGKALSDGRLLWDGLLLGEALCDGRLLGKALSDGRLLGSNEGIEDGTTLGPTLGSRRGARF